MAGLASVFGAMLIALSGPAADELAKPASTPVAGADSARVSACAEMRPELRFETVYRAALSAAGEGFIDESGDWEEPIRWRAATRVTPPCGPTTWYELRPDPVAQSPAGTRPLFLTCRHFEC